MTDREHLTGPADAVGSDQAPARPVTYDQASGRYPGITEARERFEELATREVMARAYATLKARGGYDAGQHGSADACQPLTTAEHLEPLALGEVLARYYRHPSAVHQAVQAGATWQQIADATGGHPDRARRDYRQWAAGQHRLWAEFGGRFGLSKAEHAAAIRRSAEPDREAGQ